MSNATGRRAALSLAAACFAALATGGAQDAALRSKGGPKPRLHAIRIAVCERAKGGSRVLAETTVCAADGSRVGFGSLAGAAKHQHHVIGAEPGLNGWVEPALGKDGTVFVEVGASFARTTEPGGAHEASESSATANGAVLLVPGGLGRLDLVQAGGPVPIWLTLSLVGA